MAELVNVKGLKELQQSMKTLSANVAKNVLRGAVNSGARVVRDQARSNAPVLHAAIPSHQPPGTLKRSIVASFIRERSNQNQSMFYVTVRQGKKYRGQGKRQTKSQDAYYGAWVELGHYFVAHKPSGTSYKQHRKVQHAKGVWVPAHPYLRPAYEAKKYESVDAMKQYIENRLPVEIQKARRA
jgi:HK97 gp10 family phage protein